MRIGTAVLIATLVLRVASAHEKTQTTVSVCVDESAVRQSGLSGAKTAVGEGEIVAAQVLSTAGVRLDWHGTRHCPFDAILVALRDDEPSALMPGALAYSKPFDGSSTITVFYDRVELHANQRPAGPILGHVFAHEIAHILQRVDRHSEVGVMKARWTADDFRKMYVLPLKFTEDDIDLIRLGLQYRPVMLAAK